MRAAILSLMMMVFVVGAFAQPQRGRLPTGFDFSGRAPAVGESAPDSEVAEASGDRLRVFETRGKFLVLEFYMPGNEIVEGKREAMNSLRAKYAERKDIQFWTVIGRGDYSENGQISRPEDAIRGYGFDEAAWKAKLDALAPSFSGTKLVTDGDLGVARLAYGNFINQVFLIDPKGKVVGRWSWCDPAALESAIDRALGVTGGTRVVAYSGKLRPEIAIATRAKGARRAVRAVPIARELIASGPKKYLADHDTNKSGALEATELGLDAQGFKRADRDESGGLDEAELTQVRDIAEERMAQQ